MRRLNGKILERLKPAKQVAREKPMVMVTDGLRSYQGAFKKEFFTLKGPRTQHIRKPRFVDQTNNNMVERMQGSIREREKVMRALKKQKENHMIDGFRIYYNFIRPHMALDGKTPAEQANIDLKLGQNKWKSLIRKASLIRH